tara:strand:- start:99 stop:503 length:405 start_codon:yes stop_codon:yes gene_type:complete
MKNFFGLIVLLFALTSCSGGLSGGVMNKIMESWEGSQITEAISQWGYPNSQQEIAGKKLYVWDRTVSGPSSSTSTGTISGNSVSILTNTLGGGNWNCRRILEVDDNEKIIGWQWGGNNCPFAAVGPYASWPKKK